MSKTEEDEDGGRLRSFDGLADKTISVICFLIAVGHIYVAFDPVLSELQRNAFHFAGFALLAALLYPMWRGSSGKAAPVALDFALGIAVAVSAVWLAQAETAI